MGAKVWGGVCVWCKKSHCKVRVLGERGGWMG